jgi:predicted amidohydrolase YtcJ
LGQLSQFIPTYPNLSQMKADLIVHNAQIYTVDPGQPWAEAVACANGRILSVGRSADILALSQPKTHMIDAAQRLVLPGLIDAHVHFLQYAIRCHQVSLAGVRNFTEVHKRIADAADKLEPGQWLQGWGWDENPWDIQPNAALLDEIVSQIPVALARVDMHTWWVNSLALEQAGINRETSDPPESRIERDADGEPTGILREWNAIRLVQRQIPRPSVVTLARWLTEAMGQAHRLGLTGIHDQRVEREGRRSFRLFQALRRQDQLKLRVHMHISSDFLSQAADLGLQPGFGDDRLWLGHVKAFADGTLGSQTALMLEPFEGNPDNYGLAVTPADELWELAVQANQAGFPLSVHAIGDRAVREVINVMSEFQPEATSGRLAHRIEHVQLIHPEDLPRLSQHGIVASVQPIHVAMDWSAADRNWGQRARFAYPFRSLLDQGTQLVFGSDAPVASLNPLLGIGAAVTRQDEHGKPESGWHPDERLSVAEAVQAYTIGPATLAGQSRRQGSISRGKWADMIVLSRNLFKIAPVEIAETEVDLTIFHGELVFHR